MRKQDMEPIVKTYYDTLEKGNILGRKCKKCGHIEFPPYLCCNKCGGLDTEWVSMNHVKAVVKQALPTIGAFGDPDFRKRIGDYWSVEIEIPGCDPLATSLINVKYDTLDEFSKAIREEDIYAKPVIVQDDEVKVVLWELEEDSKFREVHEIKETKKEDKAETKAEAKAAPEQPAEAVLDDVAKEVIACAATAYGVDASEITLSTDIRNDLSNESMKMIVMISEIEENLEVTIEIQEANLMNTIADFVQYVKENME